MDSTLEALKKIDLSKVEIPRYIKAIRSQDDLDYAFQLQSALAKAEDIEIRVESPWVTVYTNDMSVVNLLSGLNEERVKYISIPPQGTVLEHNTVIMPKMPYDFRITLGKTIQNHSTFVEWAEKNAKVKLTKSSTKELHRNSSWGGTHFYVTGDNNLLMVKMHLGGSISKVERIIKA